MAQLVDARIRFDDQFDDVIDDLRKLSYFQDLASIALFCGAFGLRENVRFPRAKGNRDVRIQVLNNVAGGLLLSDAIAVLELAELADPLAPSHLAERTQLFQEYVNGGLSLLSEMRKNGQLLSTAIPRLITEAVTDKGEN
jgi:hypothetical protein